MPAAGERHTVEADWLPLCPPLPILPTINCLRCSLQTGSKVFRALGQAERNQGYPYLAGDVEDCVGVFHILQQGLDRLGSGQDHHFFSWRGLFLQPR